MRGTTCLTCRQACWYSSGSGSQSVGVAFGAWWADPVTGIVVTVSIAHFGCEVTTDIARGLLDGDDPEIIAQRRAASRSVAQRRAASRSVESVTAAITKAVCSGRRLTIEAVVKIASHTAERCHPHMPPR